MNLRCTGRQVGIHRQPVANWGKDYGEKLPDAPLPAQVKTAELDELFAFIGEKWYFSDAFDIYYLLWYHFGRYEVSEGKSDIYSGTR
jgi:hypothetical protein